MLSCSSAIKRLLFSATVVDVMVQALLLVVVEEMPPPVGATCMSPRIHIPFYYYNTITSNLFVLDDYAFLLTFTSQHRLFSFWPLVLSQVKNGKIFYFKVQISKYWCERHKHVKIQGKTWQVIRKTWWSSCYYLTL